MILGMIIIFSLLGSIGSIGLAGIMLLFNRERLRSLTGILIPYAIGTLLGASFLGMIPHALERLAVSSVLTTILAGVILFYVLEQIALWRHCHDEACEVHTRAGAMILLGDSVHNFVDGVAIAAAFLVSVPLGITTSAAVVFHEVPQEIGDFSILLEDGYSRGNAFFLNLLSSLAALPGAILTYFLFPVIQEIIPYLLSISAASFIYIALADLVPGRRMIGGGYGKFMRELMLILLGVGTILIVRCLR